MKIFEIGAGSEEGRLFSQASGAQEQCAVNRQYEGVFTRRALPLTHLLFFLRRGWVNPPTRVNLPIVSRPFELYYRVTLSVKFFACKPGLSFALQLWLTLLLGPPSLLVNRP